MIAFNCDHLLKTSTSISFNYSAFIGITAR